ncbi:uncharacterized protein P884DRAFT_258437 [Thermothelomyces heterothallicus CBS 202.75]|uniref:uncharacterized protein n=1 Tax=Thermothelomyces heterothallicus CBS 202.75 TaxID=1149848 RepID=UPI0037424109
MPTTPALLSPTKSFSFIAHHTNLLHPIQPSTRRDHPKSRPQLNSPSRTRSAPPRCHHVTPPPSIR